MLTERLHLGAAVGGLVLLAIATNLPEIAITASAALSHNLGIAVGNILGGIAIQTVVLVALDAFGAGPRNALSFIGTSLQLVLEAGLVLAILVIVVMGTQLPTSMTRGRVEPAAVVIAIFWVVGLWLLGWARKGLPWQQKGRPPDRQKAPAGARRRQRAKDAAQTVVWAGEQSMNLMSSTLLLEDTQVPFDELQAEQITLFREAWAKAGHTRDPRVSVSRSVIPIISDLDLRLFGSDANGDQVGWLDGAISRFCRSYTGEPDRIADELARDVAVQAADTILLAVPSTLGVGYNARMLETIAREIAPATGWRPATAPA